MPVTQTKLAVGELKATNFGPFKDLKFQFERENGLYFITGQNLKQPGCTSNAIGKSSLFSALYWCLYGKSVKGRKAKKLLNKYSGTGYSVSFNFNGHVISRSWNPNSLTIDDKEATQEQVNTLVRLTDDQFLNVCCFRQLDPGFISLTANEKLLFLSQIFDLERWIRYSDYCKEKAKELKSLAIRLVHDQEQFALSLGVLNEKLNELIQKSEAWEIEHKAELDRLNDRMYETELEIQSPKDIEAIDHTLATKQTALESLRTAIKDLEHQHSIVLSEQAVTKSKSSQLERQIKALCGLSGKTCPSCSQQVPTEHIDSIAQDLNTQLTTLIEQAERDNLAVAESKKTLGEAVIKKTDLANKIDAIKQLKHDTELANKAAQTKLDMLRKELTKTEVQTNLYTAMVSKDIQTIEYLQSSLDELKTEIAKTDSDLSMYSAWAGLFVEYRLAVLNEIVTELELHFQSAFTALSLTGWTIQVSTTRELADESVKPELVIKILDGDKEWEFDDLSGGEAQRVKIAVSLGISELIKSRTGARWKFLLIDEPTVSTNMEGVDQLVDLLANLATDRTIWLADHHAIVSGRFKEIVKIVKGVDGISYIS
jgi:DNA repair exonuclease SbcCD ATPase subunit